MNGARVNTERALDKRQREWGMQISFLKKQTKTKKSNHSRETLPDIPDQCRTPERP